ncbi:hypothetical protein PQR14_13150 [Paraburkholderia bryophila]|uniref:hypothetical protein n=1 Tax=Burkholderiaceae TaxID=119060 RepID=UPI00054D0775|nr:hypothetical protein [Burkholderia sp. 9120]
MTNTIRRITGNIAELRYQSASELPPGAAGFTQSLRRYAPILAALSGNGGIAVSAQGQNMDVDDAVRKERIKSENLKRQGKEDRTTQGPFLVTIKVHDTDYSGWLSGICISEGDDATLIVDQANSLLGVINQKDRCFTLSGGYYQGFGYFLKQARLSYKIFLLFMSPALVLVAGFALFDHDSTLRNFAITLGIAIPSVLGTAAFLVLLMLRSEIIPSWRGTRVLSALGIQDPSNLSLLDDSRFTTPEYGNPDYRYTSESYRGFIYYYQLDALNSPG